MKKILSLLIGLCIFMTCTTISTAETNTTPQIIENYVNWNIEGSTLYISGNGRMENYITYEQFGEAAKYAPWYGSRGDITKIVIDGNIASIGSYAFADFENLTEINVSAPVRKIGLAAFRGCSSLETITLPKTVKAIGGDIFYSCSSLETIYYEGNETEWFDISMDIDTADYTVYCKTNTTPQIIENYVNWNIEGSTLYISGNGRMENYITYEQFGEAAKYAPWYGSRGDITKIVIDGNIASIGSYAFADFENLTEINVSAPVRKIGLAAFRGCSSLETITLPKTVKAIGGDIFYSCSSLETIYYEGNETEWFDISMDIDTIDYTVYCNCIPSTLTYVSTKGNSFIIKLSFVGKGNMVMLVLYKDNRFVKLYKDTYQGADISFTITEDYDEAKVMVWKDLSTLKPITDVEIVK